jgi:hypothetical protein
LGESVAKLGRRQEIGSGLGSVAGGDDEVDNVVDRLDGPSFEGELLAEVGSGRVELEEEKCGMCRVVLTRVTWRVEEVCRLGARGSLVDGKRIPMRYAYFSASWISS